MLINIDLVVIIRFEIKKNHKLYCQAEKMH